MSIQCENCNSVMRIAYSNMRRREKKSIYRCPQCKLIWAPELGTDTSFHSRLDEGNRERALKDIRLQEFVQINALVDKYVKKGARGLDVGCSYGWYMESIGKDYEIEGIEPEKSLAEKARDSGHKVYTGFFPEDMPKDAEKYEYLMFNNVWEHINHTSQLISESIKYLKIGGVMIITVPLASGGLYRISEFFEKLGRTKELVRLWQFHFHSPHIYYFTKKNLEELMKKHNCKLLKCEDVRGIDPKRMKERFEMDKDEKHGNLKGLIFQLVYPVIKRLPADKAVFVFKYERSN